METDDEKAMNAVIIKPARNQIQRPQIITKIFTNYKTIRQFMKDKGWNVNKSYKTGPLGYAITRLCQTNNIEVRHEEKRDVGDGITKINHYPVEVIELLFTVGKDGEVTTNIDYDVLTKKAKERKVI